MSQSEKKNASLGTSTGRTGYWVLNGLVAAVILGLVAGTWALDAGTRHLAEPDLLASAQHQNRTLRSELGHLNLRLARLIDDFGEAKGLESEARQLAGLEPLTVWQLADPADSPRGESVARIQDRALAKALRAASTRMLRTLTQARELGASFEEIASHMEDDADAWARIPSTRPLTGARMTSGFGLRRDPFTGRPAWHEGMDLRAPYGTPVRASAGGWVVRAGYHGGYGMLVEMDHGNGLHTRYAHNSRLCVRPGQHVRRGEILGYVGATGRASAPHLHYEVRLHGKPVNPEPYVLPEPVLTGGDFSHAD